MTKTDLTEKTIKGHRYILRYHEHINQHPDPSFLGTGMALVGELFGNDTLNGFIQKQEAREINRRTFAEKPLSEKKSVTNSRPKIANPKVYVKKGRAPKNPNAKSGGSYVPTGAKKGRPSKVEIMYRDSATEMKDGFEITNL